MLAMDNPTANELLRVLADASGRLQASHLIADRENDAELASIIHGAGELTARAVAHVVKVHLSHGGPIS